MAPLMSPGETKETNILWGCKYVITKTHDLEVIESTTFGNKNLKKIKIIIIIIKRNKIIIIIK